MYNEIIANHSFKKKTEPINLRNEPSTTKQIHILQTSGEKIISGQIDFEDLKMYTTLFVLTNKAKP